MKQILYRTFTFSLLFPALYLAGCMDTPDGFEAPQWDVNLSTPIMDTTYTLKQVVDNNPDMIKSYPKGSAQENILYYADNKKIEKVTVGDNLKMEQAVMSSQAEKIGEVKIQDPAPEAASISSSWTGLQPGQSFPIPPAGNIPVGAVFPQVNEFNYIVLSSGSIDLSLSNAMDVDVTLANAYLENDGNKVKIGQLSSSVTIPAKSTKLVSVPLNTGINIYSTLGFKGSLSTPGSNGSPVTVPQNSINISASFKNLAVSEVQGKIQVNNISINNSFQVDNQTKFQNVVISQGNLQINLSNNIDVDLSVKIKLNNLYSSSSSSTPYELNLTVPRKGSLPVSKDLSNFVLKSSTPSNVINYSVLVSTAATNDYRIVKSTDNILETVQMSQLSLRSITGIVKPTTLDIKPTTVSLNLGEMKDKFKFAKMSFKDPDLKLYLKPSSQFKVKVDGTVKAKGYISTLKFTDYISNLGGQIDSVVEVPSADLATFLSGFSPNFPEELTISGTATVNPDADPTTVYTVSQNDSITGHAEITFPFNIGIADGEFKDTTELNLKDDLKKEISKIKSVILTLQITNGLPASVKWTGSFLDATQSVKLLDLPPNRQSGNNFILVPAAAVDANGKVTAPSVKTETIEITGSDVEKFVNSKYLISNVEINTSGATSGSASPVEFKITDSIRVKASAGVVYRVNEK
ncbi:MAG: hypothetical protein ACM3QX_04760 [Syntrophomonadaceae bacterium]